MSDLSNTELADNVRRALVFAGLHKSAANAALDALLARLDAVTRERDEAVKAADGMARAPYGEYGAMHDRMRAAEADRDRLQKRVDELEGRS